MKGVWRYNSNGQPTRQTWRPRNFLKRSDIKWWTSTAQERVKRRFPNHLLSLWAQWNPSLRSEQCVIQPRLYTDQVTHPNSTGKQKVGMGCHCKSSNDWKICKVPCLRFGSVFINELHPVPFTKMASMDRWQERSHHRKRCTEKLEWILWKASSWNCRHVQKVFVVRRDKNWTFLV